MKIIQVREELDWGGTYAHGMLVVIPTGDYVDDIKKANFSSEFRESDGTMNEKTVAVLQVAPYEKGLDYTFVVRCKSSFKKEDHAATKGKNNHKRIYDELAKAYKLWEDSAETLPEGFITIESLKDIVR